jgi:hypothetical protein
MSPDPIAFMATNGYMNVEEISDDTFVNKKGSTQSMDDECVFNQASNKQAFQQKEGTLHTPNRFNPT